MTSFGRIKEPGYFQKAAIVYAISVFWGMKIIGLSWSSKSVIP